MPVCTGFLGEGGRGLFPRNYWNSVQHGGLGMAGSEIPAGEQRCPGVCLRVYERGVCVTRSKISCNRVLIDRTPYYHFRLGIFVRKHGQRLQRDHYFVPNGMHTLSESNWAARNSYQSIHPGQTQTKESWKRRFALQSPVSTMQHLIVHGIERRRLNLVLIGKSHVIRAKVVWDGQSFGVANGIYSESA